MYFSVQNGVFFCESYTSGNDIELVFFCDGSSQGSCPVNDAVFYLRPNITLLGTLRVSTLYTIYTASN